ncbi:hypothetical protein ADK70_26925 [Streptomyces rimosus subsp. pseudoverticillatus]|uniref:hypothetical protein n=1 Tax=Streptomyces rimosus TaxID=1927 RepID=UPI0006B273D8|nr:hypothetical protein [Streptomyces rimosus]KOT80896.1 hypothetical protein ADK70_26925 [Streptomyces rimosus subsp. pseudoverticillatus]
MTYSRGYTVQGRGAWSRWTCEREGCGQTGTTRGDQHDDLAAFHAARHQQEAHHEALVNDAVAALTDAREVLRLLPGVVTDVDTHTCRGEACVTPEAVTDALSAWGYQLTAMLPEPADRGERARWQFARDRGRSAACQHDHCQPVPALDLETGRSAIVR